MKPELKYEDGKLIASAAVGVDSDKDGQLAAGVEVKMFLDAKEAVAEIIKQEIPEWLKNLISKKEQEVVEANQPATEVQA